MKRALRQRLARVESMQTPPPEKEPTLIVFVQDASVPDEDGQKPEPLGEVVGLIVSGDPRRRIPRMPGESIEQLRERARGLMPDVRVFFAVYEGSVHWNAESPKPAGHG